MKLSGVCATSLAIAMAVTACAGQGPGNAEYDRQAARDEIWEKEQAIYAARGDGNLQYYVDNASEHYMGWPPGWPAPSGIDQLRAGVEQMRGVDQEELVMEFGDITFSGNAAVIYYSTHRTRMPTGESVDQRFDIAHVWVREEGVWRLLGALGRIKAKGD